MNWEVVVEAVQVAKGHDGGLTRRSCEQIAGPSGKNGRHKHGGCQELTNKWP